MVVFADFKTTQTWLVLSWFDSKQLIKTSKGKSILMFDAIVFYLGIGFEMRRDQAWSWKIDLITKNKFPADSIDFKNLDPFVKRSTRKNLIEKTFHSPCFIEQKKLYQSVLVTLFEKNKYPSLPELETASAETGQPLKRIRGWFQSQRNKERKKQGLIGSGKRLSEAEEAALKEAASAKNGGFSGAPSVVKQESMDISGEMSDSMNKTYEFPSPSGPLGQHDQNNPETLSSPKQKAPAKRKKSKDKDKAQPVTNTSMQNSLSSTGMINSMNSRFPMHPIQN